MPLVHSGFIGLPPHVGKGGFDHAAVHRQRSLLYVAHTANDSLDVIDTHADRWLRSIGGLKAIAGALVDDEHDLVFTSDRGENAIGIFTPDDEAGLVKVAVGVRPNGLAFDSESMVLLCANVGDPEIGGSHTVTLVDVSARTVLASVPVAGRTRWTVFDPNRRVFFVNLADPAEIVAIDPRGSSVVARIPIPARGPHGLDIDVARRRLYCACDDARLVCLDADSGSPDGVLELSGPPDVIFLDRPRARLYVAIGDPGVIDVVDTTSWRRLETLTTEPGAHTIALDEDAHRVYAFLPETHRAAVFEDRDALR